MIVFLLQKVSLVLPNCSGSIPESIANLLKDSDFYRLDNFDLKVFLNREFIEGFVKKGKCVWFFHFLLRDTLPEER